MVKSLDAFSGQQSRLIVVVDGLDSVEQRKVLTVLDTVHTLFSDPGSPFIIVSMVEGYSTTLQVLAIDPHVIIKAIELNLNQEFRDTSIGGHSYLRNMVHLPFFLQNAGLRKVKAAQAIAGRSRLAHSWCDREDDMSRRPSFEAVRPASKKSLEGRKKKLSNCESATNSIASNLNRMGQGPHDMNKMFLTDDYFSDVNPRSMRRLMNVIYVMGRLLKAFNIDFNWHHLSNWANITEQWPYRTSWITLFVDHSEDKLDESMSLKQVYDRVRPSIPTQKEMEPLLEMDRDEKKLDVYLSLHRKNLTVADLKIFLPFTINLDPFIKKVIKDEMQSLEELGVAVVGRVVPAAGPAPLTRRQAVGLSRKLGDLAPAVPHTPYMPHHLLPYPPHYPAQPWPPAPAPAPEHPATPRPRLPQELATLPLSSFTLDQVCLLFRSIEGINASMVDTYCHTVSSNNVSGRVLFHCRLEELKNVINMNFGDWELFKLALAALREDEARQEGGGGRQEVEEGEREAREASHERHVSRSESKFRQHKLLTSMERQVAMEEATVSGLLSTLNEEAKEDIMQEEINTAKEEAVVAKGREGKEDTEESDYLYYAHAAAAPLVEEGGEGQRREEEGLVRCRLRSSGEMIWSASNSRHGSLHDLTTTQPSEASTSPPTLKPPLHTKRRLDMADRARTLVSLTREEEREDPYAWLCRTAPASPRHSHGELRPHPADRESDPGTHTRHTLSSTPPNPLQSSSPHVHSSSSSHPPPPAPPCGPSGLSGGPGRLGRRGGGGRRGRVTGRS